MGALPDDEAVVLLLTVTLSSRLVVVLIECDEVGAFCEMDGDIERVVAVARHEFLGSVDGRAKVGVRVTRSSLPTTFLSGEISILLSVTDENVLA